MNVDTHFNCTTFVNAYDAVIFASVTYVDVHTGCLAIDTKCCFYLVKSDTGGGGKGGGVRRNPSKNFQYVCRRGRHQHLIWSQECRHPPVLYHIGQRLQSRRIDQRHERLKLRRLLFSPYLLMLSVCSRGRGGRSQKIKPFNRGGNLKRAIKYAKIAV